MSRRAVRQVAQRLFLVALALTLTVPAFAEEPVCYQTAVDAEGNPTGPSFCTQQVWFTDGGTKVGNLAATGATDFPTWDTTAPESSVTGGAGGGFATQGAPRQLASDDGTDPFIGATFEGGFTGELDNMVVELFMFAPATQAADPPGAYVGSLELSIDGQQVVIPSQVNLQLEPAGNAVLKTKFALTDLQEGMAYAGIETGPEIEHTLRFFFSAYGLVSATGAIVYDTTEVPAGITFNNPAIDPAMVVVSAG